MSGTDKDIEHARAEALRARARLARTMGEIQDRFHPKALMNEFWDEVQEKKQELTDKALHLARDKPITSSVIAAGMIAFFAREPIWRAIATRIFHRRETSPADEGLKATEKLAPVKEGEVPRRYEEVA